MTSQLLPARKPPQERITFEEFCAMLSEDQKADLIDGVIIMETPASLTHESLFGFLHFVLLGYVTQKNLGVVLGSRTAVRLSEYYGPEPDILFVSNDRRHIVKEQQVEGAPDLVVEIVSPGSRPLDLNQKKAIYGEYGVREFWLIDPYKQTTEFLRNEDGKWKSLSVDEKGIFRSEVISGFWLRVDWLFAEELPNIWEVVRTIMKGSP